MDFRTSEFLAVDYGGDRRSTTRQGSRATTMERKMFENPYHVECALSRISRPRQNQLRVHESWTSGWSNTLRSPEVTDLPRKDDAYTSKLLAALLFVEMTAAVGSTLGFLKQADAINMPFWLTFGAFAISLIVLTIYITMGRKTYPANVLAYIFFLCASLIVLIHANLSGHMKFHIYNLEMATLCCMIGSLAFLVLSYLPFFRVTRKQLFYALPPILLTLFFAVLLSMKLYRETPWSSFGIVPMAAAIIVPSAFITTIMIKHYTLCAC
ncbi:uncharacterized protein LOC100899066 [Galendromus occidentalis]|uniref:Uncharacterized protein LOC100899066 n=1 Tax=Galendromus occidentalis TaxID=34638 RepID=A0AAJ6VWU8_9ACAR|nr:uncharacterized protein LOC100899066 [Galendromus occidentalis]